MTRNLVYVDAENISKDAFSSIISELTSEYGSTVRGKFYGNKDVIGELLQIGYTAGYEFVETSSIVRGRKNVTDMKIVVDCIADVLDCATSAEVTIVSGDCDFVPLIYKLRGYGITVHTPFLLGKLEEKTLADLEEELRVLQYEPRTRQDILQPQFQVVRSILGEEFSDELICNWFTKKKRKFVKDVALSFSVDVSELAEIPVQEFGFETICCTLGVEFDSPKAKTLLQIYTQKCFGFNYPDRALDAKLSSV